MKSESFRYDGDHCLVESIEDDGFRKKIVRIKPSERPFGFPKETKLYGWTQETGEVFLESTHYRYNVRGEKTSEEEEGC